MKNIDINDLNEDQISILKLFYKKDEIFVADFEHFKLSEESTPFSSLYRNVYIKLEKTVSTRIQPNTDIFHIEHISYKITDAGKAAYEQYRRDHRKVAREYSSIIIAILALIIAALSLLISFLSFKNSTTMIPNSESERKYTYAYSEYTHD